MGWVDWEFWFWFYFLKEYKCFLNKILKKGTIIAHRRKAKQGPKPRFRKLPKNPSRVGKMSWTEIISLRFLRLKQTQCLIEYFWHKESYEVTIKPLEIETVSYSGTSLQNLEITRIKSPKLLSILKLKTQLWTNLLFFTVACSERTSPATSDSLLIRTDRVDNWIPREKHDKTLQLSVACFFLPVFSLIPCWAQYLEMRRFDFIWNSSHVALNTNSVWT